MVLADQKFIFATCNIKNAVVNYKLSVVIPILISFNYTY